LGLPGCLFPFFLGFVVEVVGYRVSVLDVTKGAEATLRGDLQLPQLCHSAVHAFSWASIDGGRRYIAHLLFLLTTRSHVKAYRIQAMFPSLIGCVDY